eukprot:TRINITY_DN6750_c0_g1_i3.p1 TRINITY_DN6750_c0_g1~~TRINITY_DN6750_c0_g1_i3.p1  ORF type:complete len:253 (+),score=43.73 TRINITY_DN6750_c0_g1_i3:152-910(+)
MFAPLSLDDEARSRVDRYLAPGDAKPFKYTKPMLIGVTGGTCCGKSQFCESIRADLPEFKVCVLNQNHFYRQDLPASEGCSPNYDKPDAFDTPRLVSTLKQLKSKQAVSVVDSLNPENPPTVIEDADVVFVRGIMVFYHQEVRDLFDIKIFIDVDSDARLSQRMLRDAEKGRELAQIVHYYLAYSKPGFEEYTLPTKIHADLIVPRGPDNTVARDLMFKYIQRQLRGHVRSPLPDRPSSPKMMVGREEISTL